MSKHYFIGIKIPSILETHVEGFKNKYDLQTAYRVIPHIDDLHVTLLYIGPLSEQHLPLLTDTLSVIAAGHNSFSMHINGLSYFGSASSPRVVYLTVSETVELPPLQSDIEITVAKQLDKPISDRFTPHVTIAKKRRSKDKLTIQKENFAPIEVPVLSFSLFTIHPEMSPKYEAVETFHLQS